MYDVISTALILAAAFALMRVLSRVKCISAEGS